VPNKDSQRIPLRYAVCVSSSRKQIQTSCNDGNGGEHSLVSQRDRLHGESYKNHVKLTFAKGASLMDPAGLFNASMNGNVRRAIDIHHGGTVNDSALEDLIRAAVALKRSGKRSDGKYPINYFYRK